MKHIRIQVSALEGLYYLADVKFFSSIPNLVEYYSRNSLVGSFPGLFTSMSSILASSCVKCNSLSHRPYNALPKAKIKIISYAIAMYDFTPTDVNQEKMGKEY